MIMKGAPECPGLRTLLYPATQSPGWVRAARPRIALIGVGLGNDDGHPNARTVDAYRAGGAVVGRTDLDGDLAVVLDGAHHLGLVRRGS